MKLKFKLFCIVFSIIITMCILSNTVLATEENVVEENIKITCYNSKTETETIKEYTVPSVVEEYVEESSQPPVNVARPFKIIDGDDRVPLTGLTEYPNRTICYIYAQNNQSYTVGTGVLVGRNTVLTAAHVLYDQENGVWYNSVLIVPAASGGTPMMPTNKPFGTAMCDNMWVPTEYQNSGDFNYDWGMIQTTDVLGDYAGFCDIESNDTSSELKNVEVVSKGYPNPTGTGIIRPYRASGKILNAYGMKFYTDLDVEKGQSGSPVFIRNKETAVIGIICASDEWNNRNIAVKINSAVKNAIYKIRAEAQAGL